MKIGKLLLISDTTEFEEMLDRSYAVTRIVGANLTNDNFQGICPSGDKVMLSLWEFDEVVLMPGHIQGPATTQEIDDCLKKRGIKPEVMLSPDGRSDNGGTEYKPPLG